MNTLLLDQDFNDLCLDASGNIAVASNPYALAQDAASAASTFAGECWYDKSLGLPYLSRIFGQTPPPLALVKAQLIAAALAVPDVVSAKVYFTSLTGRTLTGQLQVTDATGATAVTAFGAAPRAFGAPLDRFLLDANALE
jgi:hypothetical protein